MKTVNFTIFFQKHVTKLTRSGLILPSLFLLILGHLVLYPTIASAQEYINADRPDQTESPFVMGKHSMQVESGILYNHFDKHPYAMISRGLIRYGISQWMEARLLIEQGYHRDVYINETVQSSYPLAASTKILIARDIKWKTAVTLVAYLGLPFTARTKSQEKYWAPCVLMAFGNKLNQTFSIEYNLGMKQNAFDSGYGYLINTSFKYFFTKKFQGFTEYYGQLTPDQHPNHNLDTGFMYTPYIDIQFDVAVGTRIFEQGEQNQYATLGFVWRMF